MLTKAIRVSYLVSIVIMLFVVGCSSLTSPPPKLSETQTQYAGTLVSYTQAKTFKVGDAFNIGDLRYRVNGIKTLNENSGKFIDPQEGNTYLFVDITIENLGNSDVEVRSLVGFRLDDCRGRKQAFSIGAYKAVQREIDGTIAAGETISGDLCYEVPKLSQTFTLIITPNPLRFECAKVEIPLETI